MNVLRLFSRNPWPYAIIGWFILFTSAMGAWVVVAVRQNLDLVRPDYYEEEIRYQQQLERLHRTAQAGNEMGIVYEAARGEVVLRLPDAHLGQQPGGHIHFYRPSDATLDFELPLALDATGLQRVPAGRLRPGLWKVRVQWTAAGHEYFSDRSIVVASGVSHDRP